MAKTPDIGVPPSSGMIPSVVNPPAFDDPMRIDPVLAEYFDPASGQFQPATWLGPGFEINHPINGLPSAKIDIRCTNGWLVNIGSDSAGLENYVRVSELVRDDLLFQIRTARGNGRDFCFFRGYAEEITYTGRRGRELQLTLKQEATILAERPEFFVQGQLQIKRSDHPAFVAGDSGARPIVVSALPCVFNPDGAKNCHARRVLFEASESQNWPYGSDLSEFRVPVFTHSHDSNAQSWTWARVFQYLLFWLLRTREPGTAGYGLGTWPSGPDGEPISDRNVAHVIEAFGLLTHDPDQSGNPGSAHPLENALLTKPISHVIEGMSWDQAWSWTCAKSGLGRVVEEYLDYSSGKFRTGFRCFAPGWTTVTAGSLDRPARLTEAKLASPAYRTDNKSWPDVMKDNNVAQVRMTQSFAAVRNRLRVTGAPNKYEVTVELVPLWKYNAARTPQVDVNPADAAAITAAEAAVGAADEQNAFHIKYGRDGNSIDSDVGDNWQVLRYWGVPTDERLNDEAMGYKRPWGPFQNDSYLLFDLGTLRLGELQTTRTGELLFDGSTAAVRARPIGQCRTGLDAKTLRPAYVECSLDSGTTWRMLTAATDILRRRMGIFITVTDLRSDSLRAKDNQGNFISPYNFVTAYIRGLLRVRVTGTIEGDLCSDTGWLESAASHSRRPRGVMLHQPRDHETALREDRQYASDFGGLLMFAGGNSRFRGLTDQPAVEKFAVEPLQGDWRALRRLDRVRWSGTLEMPGLVTPVTNSAGRTVAGYQPGDEIEKIKAESGNGSVRKHDLIFDASDYQDTHVLIAGRRWQYDPGNGIDKPSVAMTQLQLEDTNQIFDFGVKT